MHALKWPINSARIVWQLAHRAFSLLKGIADAAAAAATTEAATTGGRPFRYLARLVLEAAGVTCM